MNKTLQTIVSLGIFFLAWKMCHFSFFDMSTISKWSNKPVVFWVLWSVEAVFMLWWLLDDMRLTYISVNPFVYVGWLWLFVALMLFLANLRIPALILVGIAALPLAVMGLFLGVVVIATIFGGPIRWN